LKKRVDRIFKNLIFSSASSTFRDLIILNSDVILYIFNNLSCFSNFWKTSKGDYLITKRSEISILGYDDVVLRLKNGKILRFKNVAYCSDFATNLVLISHFINRGIHWNMVNNTLFRDSNSLMITTLKQIACQ
jgi:hypothetical protein